MMIQYQRIRATADQERPSMWASLLIVSRIETIALKKAALSGES